MTHLFSTRPVPFALASHKMPRTLLSAMSTSKSMPSASPFSCRISHFVFVREKREKHLVCILIQQLFDSFSFYCVIITNLCLLTGNRSIYGTIRTIMPNSYKLQTLLCCHSNNNKNEWLTKEQSC